MDYEYLKTERTGEIFLLKISVPHSLNALSLKVLQEIDACLDVLDESVRVLIITGDGEKSFVAGADISQMKDFDEHQALDFSRYGARVFRKIENMDIPVIAAVNGFALGGGCELAMACDFRIASENAVFGQPEVKLGILPGFSGTYRMTQLAGQAYAKELIYTGRNIKAQEAFRIGLVNAVVPLDRLLPHCMELAGFIVRNAPNAVKYAKRTINLAYDLCSEEAMALENEYFSKCFQTKDQKEGMTAFLEKRPPVFKNE